MIYIHKEQMLGDVERRFPADSIYLWMTSRGW